MLIIVMALSGCSSAMPYQDMLIRSNNSGAKIVIEFRGSDIMEGKWNVIHDSWRLCVKINNREYYNDVEFQGNTKTEIPIPSGDVTFDYWIYAKRFYTTNGYNDIIIQRLGGFRSNPIRMDGEIPYKRILLSVRTGERVSFKIVNKGEVFRDWGGNAFLNRMNFQPIELERIQ
jgi:hypothetical protein